MCGCPNYFSRGDIALPPGDAMHLIRWYRVLTRDRSLKICPDLLADPSGKGYTTLRPPFGCSVYALLRVTKMARETGFEPVLHRFGDEPNGRYLILV